MRFQRGIHYPHPPRGPGRRRGPFGRRYHMSDEARIARRRNLEKARLRSDWESRVIKLFVWQSRFDSGPRPSERALARQLGVSQRYVRKLLRNAQGEGMDALFRHGRVTLDDLAKAREFTAKLREQGVLASPRRSYRGEARGERRFSGAMTADEIIAEQRCFAEEWKRKNPQRYGRGRRVLFSVPVR